ncbi:MAG: NAD(P)-binding domain-containing protein, partial [Propionibacteriales bacterium]|nr:NAD(P)-binding domain-containing protein [Propionibacteriales bacterium]
MTPDQFQADQPSRSAGRLTVVGAGVMGETLLSGLIRSGWSADRVTATHRRPERRAELATRYGVETTAANADAVRTAETVVLVVKP